jgi:hypothetical protein
VSASSQPVQAGADRRLGLPLRFADLDVQGASSTCRSFVLISSDHRSRLRCE